MRNSGMVEYLNYTQNQESPILFHAFVAVQLACATLGRRVWVSPAPDGYHGVPIYPNSYIVLVGPSGKVKKSSAINWGVELIQDLPGLGLIRDKLTPQYILKYLQDTPDAFVVAPELKTFIGTDAFISGLAGILTNLHDAPEFAEYRTKGSGIYQLQSPCLNILGGSTPEWLVTGTPADATSGGFSARFLYVVMEESGREVPFPYKDPRSRQRLMELYYNILTTNGEMALGEGVWEWYEKWYHQLKLELGSLDDERTLSYYSRKQAHVWKVAMALAALRGTKCLELVDLEGADQMLRWIEQTLPLAFRCVTYSSSTQLVDRVLEEIATHGGTVARSELLYSMLLYGDVMEVDSVLATLRASGLVSAVRDGGSVTYSLLRPIEDVLKKQPKEEAVYDYFYG